MLHFGRKPTLQTESAEELDVAPLRFGNFEMQEKVEYAYLGDVISSGGLAASVEATIARRLYLY